MVFYSLLADVPLIYVDNGNAKSGDETDTNCANHTSNGDTHASAVDGREHLASDDASDDPPANVHDDIEDAGKLGRPVAHEVSTDDLVSKPC